MKLFAAIALLALASNACSIEPQGTQAAPEAPAAAVEPAPTPECAKTGAGMAAGAYAPACAGACTVEGAPGVAYIGNGASPSPACVNVASACDPRTCGASVFCCPTL